MSYSWPIKNILVALFLLGLTACARQPDTRKVIHTLDEVTSLRQQLGCMWEVLPDPMYPAKGSQYSCVLDTFNSVLFYIEPSDAVLYEGVPAIDKITLLWKHWHDDTHIVSGKASARRSASYIARRFLPDRMAEDFVNAFMGSNNLKIFYDSLRAEYSYEEQPTLNLHQLDIYNRSRQKKLLAFILKGDNTKAQKTEAAEAGQQTLENQENQEQENPNQAKKDQGQTSAHPSTNQAPPQQKQIKEEK